MSSVLPLLMVVRSKPPPSDLVMTPTRHEPTRLYCKKHFELVMVATVTKGKEPNSN